MSSSLCCSVYLYYQAAAVASIDQLLTTSLCNLIVSYGTGVKISTAYAGSKGDEKNVPGKRVRDSLQKFHRDEAHNMDLSGTVHAVE